MKPSAAPLSAWGDGGEARRREAKTEQIHRAIGVATPSMIEHKQLKENAGLFLCVTS